ncbi:hypothetical protein HNP55_001267 [Paucibacter oligotrophus]|uniref:Secreted protein n=1 Tax=Roseateles oligotrophus TaxID=1769250 RepID=A0A840L7W0_9BURK|nr:hypothetical protein [Roseateles oligotrophus]MBB4842752.1 hypothetical protein [Roseateles oligotrophus]
MKINTSFMAAAVATVGLMAASAASAATVAKDSATGELRAPTAQEAQVLSQGNNGKTALKAAPRGLRTGLVNPQPVKHADGTVEQELDESSLSYSVATRNADGSIDLHCVTGAEAADALHKGKKPAKSSKAVKGHSHDSK